MYISDPFTLAIAIVGILISLAYFFKAWCRYVGEQDYDKELKEALVTWLKNKNDKFQLTEKLNVILKDYEIATTELRRRDNILLVVGTILITSSLLIFGSAVKEPAYPLSIYAFTSIGLFSLWLWIQYYTDAKLDKLSYDHLKAIEEALRIHVDYKFGIYSHIFYETLVIGKNKSVWWLRLRRSFWSIILLFLSLAWILISIAF